MRSMVEGTDARSAFNTSACSHEKQWLAFVARQPPPPPEFILGPRFARTRGAVPLPRSAIAPQGRNKMRRTPINWVRPPGPVAPGLRIGLLGGSFNPAHEGHVYASVLALKQLDLDFVWWLVSPQNPLKDTAGMGDFSARLLAASGIADNPRIVVSGIEASLGTRFTVDTLAALKRRFPGIHFVWLMGTDNLMQMPRWRDWREIFALVPVAVVARPGTALSARMCKAANVFRDAYAEPNRHFSVMPPPAWTVLDGKRNTLSATLLRASGLAKGAHLW